MKQRNEKLKLVEVQVDGEVAAGSVIPFTPRTEKVTIAIPAHMKEADVGTLIIRGRSLENEGIFDGDILIYNRKFTKREIMFEKICVVFIVATGELVAKKLLYNGNGEIVLRASAKGIKDKVFDGKDIEIKGVMFAFQRFVGK